MGERDSPRSFDVLLGGFDADALGMRARVLMNVPLVCLVPRWHPLAARDRIAADDLASCDLCLPSNEVPALVAPSLNPIIEAAGSIVWYRASDWTGMWSSCISDDRIGIGFAGGSTADAAFAALPLEGYSYRYCLFTFPDAPAHAQEYVDFIADYYQVHGES